ncbi:MAG: insulinase family protein [Bacteroidales bacterium]|nr:insulinase family protein [Bacteroidales bacterium]
MKIKNNRLLATLVSLCIAITVPAQNLHVLPSDPAITKGSLGNGLKYYVVENKSQKGSADFALIQKAGLSVQNDTASVLSYAQEALSSLPRIKGGTAQDFMTRHGMTPGRNGFVKISDDATVFHFEDILLSDAAVLDSTLLVILDIVDRVSSTDDPFVKQWYSPSDQAVVVSGDVNAKDVVTRLSLMSYMTPSSPSATHKEYMWESMDEPVYVINDDVSGDLVTLKATWRLQRTLKEYMNTVQPVIFEGFMNDLGVIATDRIKSYFRQHGVPSANVSYDYIDATESLSDESFSVSVSVSRDNLADAIVAVAHVMSLIDSGAVTSDEVQRAERLNVESYIPYLTSPLKDNGEYVDICTSSFLYNASLALKTEVMAFHASKAVSDEKELSLFNSIVSASIDGQKNLIVECSMKDCPVGTDDIRDLFEKIWSDPRTDAAEVAASDTLTLAGPGPKVKLRMPKSEPMSGGTIWTLSNGFKIIFKNMPVKDRIYYSLSMNGGYASIGGLEDGEGAYMSDFLSLCRIGGVDNRTFMDRMGEQGMTMTSRINLSNSIISGQLPDDRLDYLFQTLLAVMYEREPDEDAIMAYIADEGLKKSYQRGTVHERIAAIDSIMCPDYPYSPYKSGIRLGGGFAARAERFFRNQAAKADDGYLVLVGDIDESKLKKAVLTYCGNFRTAGRMSSRTVVSYQPVSGTTTYTVDGSCNSVDVVMSAPMSLTADNYYLAEVASMLLRRSVSNAVVATGMYPQVKHVCKIYPQERFNVMLTLNEASVDGFAAGTVRKDPIESLSVLRSVLSDLSSIEFTDAELAACKAELKQRTAIQKETPEYWLSAITKRYLDGKDFSTGADAKIDAITGAQVRSLLSSLGKGSRVEYITESKL